MGQFEIRIFFKFKYVIDGYKKMTYNNFQSFF